MTEHVITKAVVRDLYVAPSQDGRVILRIGTGEKPQSQKTDSASCWGSCEIGVLGDAGAGCAGASTS